MKKEIPKAYEPAIYEDGIYKKWEESGFFNPDNLKGEPFSIMMPPPNVTGVLHLGHALENSLMDIMARYQRMRGKKVLLLPGTDHAAVATQAKVEKNLIGEGIKNPRQDLGREKLLEKIREYAEKSKATILKQIRKMGTSCDWSRLAYTFDEVRSQAVNEVFARMYNDGLIYRGHRVVNWSVKGQSTCSDDELIYIERSAKLYTFRYSKNFPIYIATTRPETKLGDTAVAVNPQDKRYKKYIGQTFTVDVGAAKPLNIKIIADENIDEKFGTGAVGVTPAHSAVDFEIYEKQKVKGELIELIQVIGEDGRMTAEAGIAYSGLPAEEAREKFVVWLKKNDLLGKEENIIQNVGTSDRFGDIVEVLPMTQWFVAVNKMIPRKKQTLKDLMREAVTRGHQRDPKQKVKITPERFKKIYLNWIDNLRDWCISRQIWFGHRIPVWYCGGQAKAAQLKMGFHQDVVPQVFNGKTKIYRLRNHSLKVGDKVLFENSQTRTLFGYGIITEVEETIIEKINYKNPTHYKIYKSLKELIKAFKLRNPEKTVTPKSKAYLYAYKFYPFTPKDAKEGCSQIIVSGEKSNKCPACGGNNIIQDEDTLDTWFSSGLWTFSTLGWPNKTKDLKTFQPTSWMQMGYEILFFWMARMILMSTYALDEIPFKDVYIHGILRDELGKKFSKSAGNSVDPMEVSKEFGTDALRFSLISGIAPGNDSRFFEEKIEGARNLVNKLWNIARYIITNYELGIKNYEINQDNLTAADCWVLREMGFLIPLISEDLENYRFSQAGERLREFTWGSLADWYLEVSKFEKNEEKEKILAIILNDLLKLWHPFIPFVTETIWKELSHKDLLMISQWPDPKDYLKIKYDDTLYSFHLAKFIIQAIRNARAENNIESSKKIKATFYIGSSTTPERARKFIDLQKNLIKNLRTGISELEITEKKPEIDSAIYVPVADIEIYLIGARDEKKEKERIKREMDNLEKIIKITEAKLSNKEFMEKAPEKVVNMEKEKLVKAESELKKLREQTNG